MAAWKRGMVLGLSFWAMAALLVAALAWPLGSDTAAAAEGGDFAAQPVHWYEGSVRMTAWMALDEAAVLRGSAVQSGKSNPLRITDHVMEQEVIYQNPLLAYITLNQPLSPADPRSGLPQFRARGVERPVSPVFFPDRSKESEMRMALSGEIIVKYKGDIDAAQRDATVSRFNLRLVKKLDFVDDTYLYLTTDVVSSLDTANAIYESGVAEYAYPNWFRSYEAAATPGDPLYPLQWHLNNTGQNQSVETTIRVGNDINAENAWSTTDNLARQLRGIGVAIAFVDNGCDLFHEDLIQNKAEGFSWNFLAEDTLGDASDGAVSQGEHGTMVAGVAAARGFSRFNDLGQTLPLVGGSGVAPFANFAAHQIFEGDGIFTINDTNVAAALTRNNIVLIDIYNNSWTTVTRGFLNFLTPLTQDAMRKGVLNGRPGTDGEPKGSVFVWSAGNGGAPWIRDNSNLDGFTNSRYVIAVGASNDAGTKAFYSEEGANVLVNAPSSGGAGSQGILTTFPYFTGQPEDANATKYVSFGGTSAAAPIVSGVVALMLQANPDLTWRDVRHVLIESAEQNDADDFGWTINGAGFPINHKYGFGRVDAAAAGVLAREWDPVGEELALQGGATPNQIIPDNNTSGFSSTIPISRDIVVEFVEVFFTSSDHPNWGDLEIVLTSPMGTESILAETRDKDYPAQDEQGTPSIAYNDWRFGTVRHYKEDSEGLWTLTVRDQLERDIGTFENWAIRIYGHQREGTGFEQVTLTVELEGDGLGSVTSSPSGIDCGADCVEEYDKDSLVTLLATPGLNSVFDGWEGGGCSGEQETCEVPMSEAVTVTATFNTDSDGDGVSDVEENGGFNDGDADQNGVPDAQEVNVVSFLTGNGQYAALIAPDSLRFTTVEGTNTSPDPENPFCGGSGDGNPGFPLGYVGFVAQSNVFPLAPVDIEMLFPRNDNLTSFWSFLNPEETGLNSLCWAPFLFEGETGAQLFQEGDFTRVILHLEDGELGDSNREEEDGLLEFFGAPTSILQAVDTDGDGVPDETETGGLNEGDADQNLVIDSEEANVANLLDQSGSNSALVAPFDTAFSSARGISNPSPLDAPDEQIFRSIGFFDFQLNDVTPDGCVDVSLVTERDPWISTYYNYGPTPDNPNPHWYQYIFDGAQGLLSITHGEQFSTAVLRFCDGGRGDNDLVDDNGVILGTGGPATVYYSFNLDSDGDSQLNGLETAASASGDADGNGIPDAAEAQTTAMINTADESVALVTQNPNTKLSAVSARVNPDVGDTPEGFAFPSGFYSYAVTDLEPGACVTTVLIQARDDEFVSYYNYGQDDLDGNPDSADFYTFIYDGETGVQLSQDADRSRFILELCDGKRGDHDLTANGVIQTFGGPAKIGQEPGTGDDDDDDFKTSTKGGGGCTVNPAAGGSGAWTWLVFAGLWSLAAWRARRNR